MVSDTMLKKLDAWWRASNFLSAGQLYLLDNPLLKQPLKPEHIKKKIVGKLAKIGKPLKKIPLIDKIFHRITGSTDYSKAPENMKKTLVNMLESDKALKIEDVKTHYAIIGIAAGIDSYPLYYDACNEKGLVYNDKALPALKPLQKTLHTRTI